MPRTEALPRPAINNAFYDDLGDRWYTDDRHAIALLRAESRLKVEYVKSAFARHGVPAGASVLDIACGAGFISLPLAEAGYHVTGIDLSAPSLTAAQRQATAGLSVEFHCEDALHLTRPAASYDAVLLLDFLEHVPDPAAAVREATRVLKPGGVMVLHTFNRTLPARLLAIKAMELFTRDCPEHVHVYEYFITPAELVAMVEDNHLQISDLRGLRPDFLTKAFVWSLLQRRLHPEFAFTYTRSLEVGYLGTAVKSLV